MANRRMFSLDVVDTDKFLDMPTSAQCLYFHLGMRADDDGFIASPKQIMRMANCCQDDMNILISKGFVIPFNSGIVVIRHWKQHNYIQSDRYRKTKYTEEMSHLDLKENVYIMDTERIQSVPEVETQYRLSKDIVRVRDRVRDKDRGNKSSFTPPTTEEVKNYCKEKGFVVDVDRFVDFYESKGWMVGSNKMKDWKAAVRNWARRDNQQSGSKVTPPPKVEDPDYYDLLGNSEPSPDDPFQ